MSGPGARERLRAYGQHEDADIPLATAALDLAQWSEPHLNLAPYHRHLQLLSSDVRAYIGADEGDSALAIEAARQILARRYGYCYLDDAVVQVNQVRTIDRRCGGAETLAILYAHVLSEHVHNLELLAFSTRILLGIPVGGERLLIDPLSDGRPVSARHMRQMLSSAKDGPQDLTLLDLKPLSSRQILLRLQDGVKTHQLRHAAPEAATQALEASILLAPNEPRLWRELGVLYARQDQLLDAARALERFLTLPGNDAQRYTASQLLQELTHRINKGDL
ncbi:tetratricopeptide repeat protein [Magnetovibrio sp. PR-2]|uniref:transglutaminase family protein n=1 Tax=Magnetovibrio sp. PR-2 TaxID=3120356 RepID=UPI002FCE4EB4